MIDAGAQHSRRPGEHLKNAFVYQRDIDRFTPVVQGMLQPVSVPSGAGASFAALDPVSFIADRTIRHGQNPEQDPRVNLSAAAVSYGVGGMFTHWTNNTPRHHPTLERYGGIGDAEWNSLYAAAEDLVGTRTDVFAHSIRHQVVKEALSQHYGDRLDLPVQELPVAGHRRSDNDEFVHYTGSDTILGPLLEDTGGITDQRFTLLPEHRLTRLVLDGERVAYAEVEDLMHWETVRVEARDFIVAAGSLLTPQILWKSGIRPNALGRYLTEHPMTFTQIVLRHELVEGMAQDIRFADQVGEIAPNDPVKIPMHDPPPMVWIPLGANRPWHSQVHRDSFSYGQLPSDVDDRLVVDLRWFGMTDANPNNRLSFLDEYNDKFGMPKPMFHFRLGNQDRTRIHDMMSDMVESAQALGGFLPGAEPRFMPLGTSLHFMGTYRMGLQPDGPEGESVVDGHSKVWGFENLYLGGNGVIPTSTAANPTLTSIALSLRAATKLTGLTMGDIARQFVDHPESTAETATPR